MEDIKTTMLKDEELNIVNGGTAIPEGGLSMYNFFIEVIGHHTIHIRAKNNLGSVSLSYRERGRDIVIYTKNNVEAGSEIRVYHPEGGSVDFRYHDFTSLDDPNFLYVIHM